jgi:glycosyltransferase involved in cell wall biosynthesis
LTRYLKDHRLETVVRLAGRLPRERVLDAMSKSRILLHTSRYEGQGYVFLEALGSGMRVVCRDVGYTGTGKGAYRCKSNEEMVEVLKTLLESSLTPLDSDVIGIDDTVRTFENIYGLAQRQ